MGANCGDPYEEPERGGAIAAVATDAADCQRILAKRLDFIDLRPNRTAIPLKDSRRATP
jgi:hypothetical protein